MNPLPERCSEVSFDMRDDNYGQPLSEAEVGDLLWNPKGPEGHVLVGELPCDGGRTADCGCGGWGMQPCPSTTLVCECGEDDSWRDHHYALLAKRTRS